MEKGIHRIAMPYEQGRHGSCGRGHGCMAIRKGGTAEKAKGAGQRELEGRKARRSYPLVSGSASSLGDGNQTILAGGPAPAKAKELREKN